ncbi:TIR domain-containing protein [Erythrobacteraceae bacterium WH01K]|nr:TIR domain-containing protein [Erythrobacteraceae bacterium WH01K]
MARNVFFSFHFDNDYWRTQTVRNIGSIDGQSFCNKNKWEEIKQEGAAAIEKWIDENMTGKSCVVVLVGSQTSERKWVQKEISKGWNKNKGVVAIRIHKLLDSDGKAGSFGSNPLDEVSLTSSGKKLSSVAKIYNPSGSTSKEVYKSIADNIEDWIEEAIKIRGEN